MTILQRTIDLYVSIPTDFSRMLTELNQDLRPFLYPSFWQNWGFKKIDKEVEKLEAKKQKH
jgi:hypothetical protein